MSINEPLSARAEEVPGADPRAAQLALMRLARAAGLARSARRRDIERVDRGGRLPLSFAQQRLWFLEQMGGLGNAYHVPLRLRLRGTLDAAALRRALDGLVARHEVLRTTFHEQGGEPEQRIGPDTAGFHLVEHDLAGQPDGLERVMAEEAAAPFDLEQGPPIRGRLVRLAADEHVLLLTMHHIASDGWSMGVLFRELSALYEAYREGREPPLPELPVQYADYAAWQRGEVEAQALEEQASYWTRTLAGAPGLLELPTDHPRPQRPDHAGASVSVVLDEALAAGLKALGRRHGATLFMTLLAGWSVVLSRLSGQDVVVVGTDTANRGRREVEGLIGFFVNALAVRVDLAERPTVATLMAQVKRRALEAQANQDIPFEQVVERVQPARTLAHNPLFQVLLSWQNAPGSGLRLGDLELERVPGVTGPTAKFDLSLSLGEEPDGRVAGALTYATSLFEHATVERHAGYLRRVLEEMAAGDARPVDRLVLLPQAERRLVVHEWNRTERSFPAAACVHELFEAQAERTPDAVALAWGGEALSYRELNARASRVAEQLARLGVGPEERVGVLLERTLEQVVATLAVLKAGGCCVPVDPGYPPERMALMLADAGARVVVSERGFAGARPVDGAAWETLWMEDALRGPDGAPSGPRRRALPRNLAYLFYTSGSTGRPKGVMMSHREVVQFAAGLGGTMPLGPGHRVAQGSNVSFDAAVFELWGAWLHGAAVVGLDRDVLLSASALHDALRAQRITHLYQTAALFNQHVLERPDVYASLEQLVFGAEAVGTEGVRLMLARGRPRRVLHEYGPTEATVWCTLERVESVPAGATTVPIGHPVPNARAYVLDPAGEPLPVGAAGDLFIGGDGVVRGYLGRPGLTAERFVPDPFAAEPGARMYRTGDRARWRAEGKLEFMGRLDDQVKVRGFRIEPGEVEAAIAAFPGVRETRVMVREDQPGDKRLVAYVVGSMELDGLRAHLRQGLPEYMVPRAIVALERLPLTPNGKVDRKALPVPEYAAGAELYVAPRTPTEEVLAGIWGEVLRLDRVGVEESFFDLGGHSLLATRVVSRVRAVFPVELPLRVLFEGPTVAEMARAIEEMRRAELPVLPPVVPVERTGTLPLSFAQERLWFIDRLEPGSAVYNIPVAWRLAGALNVAALERSLSEIVRRHESLRTVFAEVDGTPVQVIAPFGGFVLPVEELSGVGEADREAEARRRAGEEARRPFDLSAGPLFRAALLRLGAEDHVLLLSVHHVVSDGWSMGVLQRELSALYGAFREGRESPLPELAVQYADYAVWQREQLAGEVLDRQIANWRERLAGAPELLELPTDRPRPAVQTFRGATVPFQLSAERMERLQALGRSEGATLYMTLLGAFQVLLSKYGGGDDIVVGSPIAGRTRREVEELIGFFVNTLVLRTDLSGDPSFREVLRRVRKVTLGAYENQEVPFEKLVAELQPERSLSHSPLFQVVFALQNAEGAGGALPGLEVSGVRAELASAKFDLTLLLTATGQGVHGALNYNTDLFERDTAARMLGHLSRVLEQVAADADVPLSRLELLPEAERRLVVEEWNATDAGYPREVCVHELFRAQAARTPEAAALSWRGERWTYAELQARANRISHALRRRGAGPEVRVGICLPRTPELVAAMLGVLGAGGAYVPLDPAYPRERLGYMLQDARVTIVITESGLADRLPEGAATLLLDVESDAIAAESADPFETGILPENLSHVIFTSGSTGRPKGVMIRHSSVVVLLHWLRENVTDRERSSVLFSTSINFDVSIAEVFGTLAWGGKLVLVENALELATLGEDVVHVSMVPSAAEELLRGGAIPPCVKTLNLGGEALPSALAQGLYALGTVEKVGNLYGPTEDTTYSTYYVVPRGADEVLVGRPVANTRAYVVDAHLRPVPVGIVGELYLAGDGLSRGYANRPAMTAERFVPCPFGPPGARMYRVMDRVRWKESAEVRECGSAGVDAVSADSRTDALTHSRTAVLEYLGRTDFQVKVRGYRIELGEIEARLAEHPGVRAPVVHVREDAPGDRRLVAYYLAGEPAAVDALKTHLADRLPGYMVPAAYVWMEAYPQTPNGKVDRRALPAPEGDAYARSGYEAPVGETELALADIWSELLGVERVGRWDNFFELGGHSLLILKLIERMRRRELHVEVGTLFTRPTIAELAEEVSGDSGQVPVPPNLIPGLDMIDTHDVGSRNLEVVL